MIGPLLSKRPPSFPKNNNFWKNLATKKKMETSIDQGNSQAPPKKLHGYEFYRSIGSPKYICAPMVEQSDLAFRILVKKYGCQLAYTPMLHSKYTIQVF